MDALNAALPFVGSKLCLGYLDPASGSMLLQILLGGIGGAAVALKLGWRHIAPFVSLQFLRKKRETEAPSDSPKTDEVTTEPARRRAA